MSDPIRVFVTDDHSIIRKGIKAAMELFPDIEIVGEAANGKEALEKIKHNIPDVVLMDLIMPEMNGIETIEKLVSKYPNIRILVLTTFSGEELVFPAIKAGALGYHLKDSETEDLAKAIRQVAKGESSLHPAIARKVLQEISQPAETPRTPDPLTLREIEVLKLVAQGRENHEIAELLVISEATVRTHVSNIMSKLHLASRTQAALYALKEGLASLDSKQEN
jgi:NarL family two-component system response regulator LiaR